MKFKRKRPERKNYVIEDEEYELELLKNYLTHFDVWFQDKILSLENNHHFVNTSSESVHTLPYYVAIYSNDIDREPYDRIIRLMQKNNFIVFCDREKGQEIVRVIDLDLNNHGYDFFRSIFNELGGNIYFHDNYVYSLDEEPLLIGVENEDINILELLRDTRQNGTNNPGIDSEALIDKKEIYLKLRELLDKYFKIIKSPSPTDGVTLINCICDILNCLRLFPEYIDEKKLIKLFNYIPISNEDYNRYVSLLESYNNLEEQIESGEASDDNIARKIAYYSEMQSIIRPVIEDQELKSVLEKVKPYFNKDIQLHKLTNQEEQSLRLNLIHNEKKYFSNKKESEIFSTDYSFYEKNKPQYGGIGETSYALIGNGRGHYAINKYIEIHTKDGVFTIGITDDKKTLTFKEEFFTKKFNGVCTLEVHMPLEGKKEMVSLKTPNGNEEMFAIFDDGRCSVFKDSPTSSTIYHYNSFQDFLLGIPCDSNTTEKISSSGILGNLIPPIPPSPELNKLTLFAIEHSIRGVIPKEILEIYRSIMPTKAALIDNYGVSIPKESEMFRIPYYGDQDFRKKPESEKNKKDFSDNEKIDF